MMKSKSKQNRWFVLSGQHRETKVEVVQGNGFQAEVVRTKRKKTAAIKIDAGKVIVMVPKFATTPQVEELVSKKTRWIRDKLLRQQDYHTPKPKEYVSGEYFTYLGKDYRLDVISGSAGKVTLLNDKFVVHAPPSVKKRDRYIHNALTKWYRKQAYDELRGRVDHHAKTVGIAPASVSIRSFKSRWGSCSAQGHIQFNWKIIIAPIRIVDYVVVHELCHLIEHNHSPRYWKCVERVFPDYRDCKDWLKENGMRLKI